MYPARVVTSTGTATGAARMVVPIVTATKTNNIRKW
jgi:hypothetical protein